LTGVRGWPVRWLLHHMRFWDQISSQRVDFYMTNSKFVSRRIRKYYGREAVVVPPPVNTDIFQVSDTQDDFYLTVSRLVLYKRVDLIAEAFSSMPDKNIVIIGDGPEMHKIKSKVAPNVILLGHQPDSVVQDYLGRCKVFVFAAEEDLALRLLRLKLVEKRL